MKQNKYLKKSSLDIYLLELVRLRIGQINACAYCMKLHHNELKLLGESDLRISLLSVWNKVLYFSMKERAVLALTDKLVIKNKRASFETIHNLLQRHFNEEEIQSLIVAIKQIDNWTRLMKNKSAC